MVELEIKDLYITVGDKEIVKGIDLKIKQGEVHVIMGPNGSGKSSLSYAVMGHPKYKVKQGDILMNKKSILNLPVNKRAELGLFLGFQYPQEVDGVGISNFLRTSLSSIGKPVPDVINFRDKLKKYLSKVGLTEDFIKRSLNVGYSGGEKKRCEILQLSVLKPKIAILDEPDSGADIDGLKAIAEGVNIAVKNKTGTLLITHYNRILKYVKPDFVHVLIDGKIIKSGGPELANKIEKQGYSKVLA